LAATQSHLLVVLQHQVLTVVEPVAVGHTQHQEQVEVVPQVVLVVMGASQLPSVASMMPEQQIPRTMIKVIKHTVVSSGVDKNHEWYTLHRP
jgi:hypothetical protein